MSGLDQSSAPPEQRDASFREWVSVFGCMLGALIAVLDIQITNSSLPEIEGGKIVYKMQPEDYAAKARELIKAGANIVGGCCGTSPAFIKAIV